MGGQVECNWRVNEEDAWKGQTAFIVGGGPSVALQRPHRLEGRRVIVVNSSYETCPFADFIFFGDNRWHGEHRNRPAYQAFVKRGGRVCTVSHPSGGMELLKLHRIVPTCDANGLTTTRVGLSCQKTSYQGAMNLAVMLGATRLVLLGMDGKRNEAGMTHHHTPHKWPTKEGTTTWDRQQVQLRFMVQPLRDRGIDVFNVNPDSNVKLWPYAPIEDFLTCPESIPSADNPPSTLPPESNGCADKSPTPNCS